MKTLATILILILALACSQPKEQKTSTVLVEETPAVQTHSTQVFINGFEILYDCFNRTPSYNDSVIVFAKKDTVTNELFKFVLGDFYFAGIIPYFHNGETFLLANTSHTYEHSKGYLYYLDTISFKTNAIELPKNQTQIPNSLDFWKEFGLRIENGKLYDGALFRSKISKELFKLEREYALEKKMNSTYSLVLTNEQLIKEE